tara:strand:- start:1701 stop:2513 length:813 start_codon:yes stop_codon:yes gene_type:complete
MVSYKQKYLKYKLKYKKLTGGSGGPDRREKKYKKRIADQQPYALRPRDTGEDPSITPLKKVLVIIDSHGCTVPNKFKLPENVTVGYPVKQGECAVTDQGVRNYSMLNHFNLHNKMYAKNLVRDRPFLPDNVCNFKTCVIDEDKPNDEINNIYFQREEVVSNDHTNLTWWTANSEFLNTVQIFYDNYIHEYILPPLSVTPLSWIIKNYVLPFIMNNGGSSETKIYVYVNTCRNECADPDSDSDLDSDLNSDSDSDSDLDLEEFVKKLEMEM